LPNAMDFFLAGGSVLCRFGPWVTLVLICVAFLLVMLEEREVSLLARENDRYVTMENKQDMHRHDGVRGWITAANHNQVSFEVDSFRKMVEDCMLQWRRWMWYSCGLSCCRYVILQGGHLSAFALVIYDIADGQRRIGDLTALVGLWGLLLGSVEFFNSFISDQVKALLYANRFRKIMERKGMKDGDKHLNFTKGDVEFEEVSFSYPDLGKSVLQKVSFRIEGGSTVGIVGQSGIGKSTMFHLLMRQEVPNEGTILVDGQEIHTLTKES